MTVSGECVPSTGVQAACPRILVAEDQAIVALDIQRQLHKLRYEVVGVVSSARDAIRQAGELRPDLALLDIHLDDQRDGIDVADALRTQYRIPVVFLTAYADAATLERARSVEPYGYLVKPFTERDLHTAIQVALGRAEHDRSLRRQNDDLQAILDVQRQGLILIDERGDVTFVNRAAAEMLGVEADRPVGRPWQKLFQAEASARAQIGELLAGPPAAPTARLPRVKFGRPASLVVEVEVLADPRNASNRIVALHDVSRMAALQERVEKPWCFEQLLGKSAAMHARLSTGSRGRSRRFHGDDRRSHRHRQGTGRPGDSQPQPP